MNGAKKDSAVWDYLRKIDPDIALLQEVGSLPDSILNNPEYSISEKAATRTRDKKWSRSTDILAKNAKISPLSLSSEHSWVNKEIEFLNGNLVGGTIQRDGKSPLHIVSVYSPAWSLNESWKKQGISPSDEEVMQIKLEAQKWKVFATEILWSALKKTMDPCDSWIIGGDFNSSETFDPDWQNAHPEFKKWMEEHKLKTPTRIAGSRKIIDRMNNLGLIECLRPQPNDKIIPTYKNKRYPHRSFHQIDHLYVTKNLYSMLNSCEVGNQTEIFDEKHLSDHLPIIADFK